MAHHLGEPSAAAVLSRRRQLPDDGGHPGCRHPRTGGAGNNTSGLDAGSSIIEQAGSNANLRISLAGGAGGNAGSLAAKIVPAGGTASGTPGEAGDANIAAPAGPGPGQGGGGGAGCTGSHASGQGRAGGLYGGGGGGSGAQNNSGTTKPGGSGAATSGTMSTRPMM